MKLNILGRSWKFKKIQRVWQNTKYKSMYEIQEVLKCYLCHIFTSFLWTHLLRSKPIIERPFKCLKRWFGFLFQASSSVSEDLSRAYTRGRKKSALIDDWVLANSWGAGFGRWQLYNPRKSLQFLPSFKIENSFSRT